MGDKAATHKDCAHIDDDSLCSGSGNVSICRDCTCDEDVDYIDRDDLEGWYKWCQQYAWTII
jgi:hypothetical protein